MNDMVKLILSRTDVGQIVEGLQQRLLVWQATAQYHQAGYTNLSDIIEECSDQQQAQAIADYYKNIIGQIQKQLNSNPLSIDGIVD